jgi:3-methyladenine DNA glycosylase AlkD
MNAGDVMSELERLGTAQTRKTYSRHGAPESMFGVKIGDLKPLAKKLKGQQELALALYETGNSDAMYLAGLVADGGKMSKKQLEQWAKGANWYLLAECTIPGVACESPHAADLARKWIKSKNESIAAAGWATWSGIVATREDEELDLSEIRGLLKQVEQ